MIPELPDIYETRQGHALRQAIDRGDADEARRIIRHVLAEAALTPEEREEFEQTLTASLLFREQMHASERGDETTAARIADMMHAVLPHHVIIRTVAAAYLQAGLREGLPADRHDQLMGWVDELGLGEEIRTAAASIRRLPDEETGR